METYFAQKDGAPLPELTVPAAAAPAPAPAPAAACAGPPPIRRVSESLMFERRLYFHIDWLLIAAVFALCAVGLAMIYSATGGPTSIYWTQIYAIGLGIASPWSPAWPSTTASLGDKSHLIFLVMVLALVGVLFFGEVRGGSRRWIDLGPFNLQPSEFAKATVALMLAKMLGRAGAEPSRPTTCCLPGCSPRCRCCSSRGSRTWARP